MVSAGSLSLGMRASSVRASSEQPALLPSRSSLHLVGVCGVQRRYGAWGRLGRGASAQRPTRARSANIPDYSIQRAPTWDIEVVGVVIVHSGAQSAESDAVLVEFAKLYRQSTKREIVAVAHMAPGSLEQAVMACVERGANKIVVVPYTLARGGQEEQQLPFMVADVQRQLPRIKCVIVEAIRVDSIVAQLVESSVKVVETKAPDVSERGWEGGLPAGWGSSPAGALPGNNTAGAVPSSSQPRRALPAWQLRQQQARQQAEARRSSPTYRTPTPRPSAVPCPQAPAAGGGWDERSWAGGQQQPQQPQQPQQQAGYAASERPWGNGQQRQQQGGYGASERSWGSGQQQQGGYGASERSWSTASQQQQGNYGASERAWGNNQQGNQAASERSWAAAPQQQQGNQAASERSWAAAPQQQGNQAASERSWSTAPQPQQSGYRASGWSYGTGQQQQREGSSASERPWGNGAGQQQQQQQQSQPASEPSWGASQGQSYGGSERPWSAPGGQQQRQGSYGTSDGWADPSYDASKRSWNTNTQQHGF